MIHELVISIFTMENPLKRSSAHQNQIDPDVFPTTTPLFDMTSLNYPLSPRDDLPPPSGEEQMARQTSQGRVNAPLVSKKPVHKKSVPTPPVPAKPKPSVSNSQGQHVKPFQSTVNGHANYNGNVSYDPSSKIQGDQDEIVTSSRSRDFFRQQEQNMKNETATTPRLSRSLSNSSASSTSSEIRTRVNEIRTRVSNDFTDAKPRDIENDDQEIVTSANSRDFFKKQEQRTKMEEENALASPFNRQRSVSSSSTSSTSSDSRLRSSQPPPPAPKPITISENLKSPTMNRKQPPAPPLRKSSHKEKNEDPILSPTASKPSVSPQLEDFLPPPPVMSPPPLEEEISFSSPPPPPEEWILSSENDSLNESLTQASLDDLPVKPEGKQKSDVQVALGETEDIMAGIMADINDFNAQLENMF